MFGWAQSLLGAVAGASLMDCALLAGAAAILVYWLGTRSHGHFRRLGLPFTPPVPFLGNMAPFYLGRASLVDFMTELYKKHEGASAFGLFQSGEPIVVLRHPDLVKQVGVKDFDHFVDHQQFSSPAMDPLIAFSLISLNGQRWRDMRATLSPAFTSSKMRNLFKLIDQCGRQTADYLKSEMKSQAGGVYERDMKEFFTRVTNDVIATSAFGIECNSLKQPTNEFYRMARDLTNTEGFKSLILFGYQTNPKLMEFFRLKFIREEVHNFFHGLVNETARERQKKDIYRPDMLQLLMQARRGELKHEDADELETVKGAKTIDMDDMDMAAQAIIFLFAGLQTVSTAFSFCAYTLAMNQEMQERVQREVDDVFESIGGQLTFEAAQRLKYVDKFVQEVLRMYPPVVQTDRKCTADFTLTTKEGLQYPLRKGEYVWLPIYSLHHDERFWPEPEKFDPERFSEENKANVNSFAYMPFGTGPRACIGSRFALLEIKVVLAYLLRNFNLVPTQKTPKEVKFTIRDFDLALQGGFWIGVTSRR